MNLERMRAYLLKLPHVVECEQFGGLVYWAGDKAIGGKLFAMMNADSNEVPVSYAAGAEHFAELVEREGFRPAAYLARAFWVTVERWDVLRTAEWEQELAAAHALVLGRLAPGAKKVLALPPAERRRVVAERSRLLAAKEAAKKAAKSAEKGR